MPTDDAARAHARFLAAQRRITAGLERQQHRIVTRTARAPRLPAGPDYELIDLRGDAGNDIDYYVYELARLQDLAREVNKTFGNPPTVVEGLTTFEAAFPALRKIRNPLTHPSDDKRLDDVAWFDAVVTLRPSGDVEYLVDPRYEQHAAALDFSRVLADYLEEGYRRQTACNRRDNESARGGHGRLTGADA
ncbi:MAG: hypothetical protein LC808_35955 [Actinobacteria bacterium]|nr:hypothetical protein [Actinomycetota bacterium]